MTMNFPDNIQNEEGQMIRCILQEKIRNFWIIRNYFINKRNLIDILIGLEDKHIYALRNFISLLEHKKELNGRMFYYATFQYFIYDIASIFDSYALFAREYFSLCTLNDSQISFRSKKFMGEISVVCPDLHSVVSSDSFKLFLSITKLLRDSYIHRGSPNSVTRISESYCSYNVRLFRQDMDIFRGLCKSDKLLELIVEYDSSDQIELSVAKLLSYLIKMMQCFSNEICYEISKVENIPADLKDDSARLGELESKVEEISRVYDFFLFQNSSNE